MTEIQILPPKPVSYQRGTVVRIKRKNRPDAWVLRFYEYDLLNERVQRAVTFSDVNECSTKADAERKADRELRPKITAIQNSVVHFRDLADRYEKEALPPRGPSASSYRSVIGRLRRRFNDERLDWMAVHPFEIEEWIKGATCRDGRPLANDTRRNIRAILYGMFKFAMKCIYIQAPRNPIALVELRNLPRNLRKVRRRPVLTSYQLQVIWADQEHSLMVRTMIWLALCTGLRIAEVLGLRWEDIDFDLSVIHVCRSSLGRYQMPTKTISSEADVPMHPLLETLLLEWKEAEPSVNGWVFGSFVTGRPFHAAGLQSRWLIPLGKKIGIDSMGWHTLRHTYRAMLRRAGTELETQRDLMRHSSIATTEEYGTEDPEVMAGLKKANARIVEIFPLAKRA